MLIGTGLSYRRFFGAHSLARGVSSITMIAPGGERWSRPDAVEKGDVFLRLQKARDPLEPGAMLSCDEGRALDIAAIADLGRTCVALQQEWFWAGAGRTHATDQDKEQCPPSCHILEATAPRKNGKD
jgi:hypothetical protein